jgi:hypothetical protein
MILLKEKGRLKDDPDPDQTNQTKYREETIIRCMQGVLPTPCHFVFTCFERYIGGSFSLNGMAAINDGNSATRLSLPVDKKIAFAATDGVLPCDR